ncbi:hypothetical protein [Chryseobacterium sp. S90]
MKLKRSDRFKNRGKIQLMTALEYSVAKHHYILAALMLYSHFYE